MEGGSVGGSVGFCVVGGSVGGSVGFCVLRPGRE